MIFLQNTKFSWDFIAHTDRFIQRVCACTIDRVHLVKSWLIADAGFRRRRERKRKTREQKTASYFTCCWKQFIASTVAELQFFSHIPSIIILSLQSRVANHCGVFKLRMFYRAEIRTQVLCARIWKSTHPNASTSRWALAHLNFKFGNRGLVRFLSHQISLHTIDSAKWSMKSIRTKRAVRHRFEHFFGQSLKQQHHHTIIPSATDAK